MQLPFFHRNGKKNLSLMELEGTSNCNQIGSLTDVGNEIGENR